MNKPKFASVLMGLMTAVAITAQDNVDEWMLNGRPECVHETAAGTAPHGRHKIGSQATASLKAKGVKKVPVVLVAFSDLAFSAADLVERDADDNIVSRTKGTDEEVNAFYQKFCNGTMDGSLYRGHGSYGSIRDYYVQQSDSIFLPEFVVIGPVTLDKGHAHYGANNGNSKDINFSQFRNEAIAKAMEQYTDWGQFDNDGNNTIDMVFFIYAGMGESNTKGKYPNLIWPKEFQSATTINGKVFSVSAATCECRPLKWLNDTTETGEIVPKEVLETRTDGIGVFCHELSHALGLPDFYDTEGRSFGMDIWSVMDYGEYGSNGYCPGNYTAYEREFMGWRPLIELTEPCVLTIPCFADGGTGYKIVNEANPQNEYYIIENRQRKGWDSGVGQMGHGLQVTHVDFQATRWNNNTVNTDANHQRMTIIAANNRYIGSSNTSSSKEWMLTLSGNLWPGDTENGNLTDTTTPAATVFTGGFMGKPLRNITENEDGTITVCYRTNGKLAMPEISSENITTEQLDMVWTPVEHATKYAYELYKEGQLLKSETITETTVHLEGLQPSTEIGIRVKAMADSPEDYIESEWSELVKQATLDPAATVTANDLTMEYGDDVPELTYTAEGASLGGTPALDTEVTSATPVGTYPIVVSEGNVQNNNVTYVAGTLTVTPAPLTVVARSYTREKGFANPDFEVDYEGFKNGEDESVLTSLPILTCVASEESEVGDYDILVGGAEADNYEIGYVNGVLTIIPPAAVASIVSESERVVDVFTMSGVRVSRCFGDELGRLSLRRGIYVVRYNDGTARQVLIK